ncbi:MAG: nitroreductase [Lachnospiraceae bacterium]
MNQELQMILSRRSVKKYEATPVSQEDLDAILEAGTYAPSGMGAQSPLLVAVTNKAVRDELSALNAAVMGADMDPFYGAPAVIVVLADRSLPTHVEDGSVVLENLQLAAHALGLGSCWVHRAKEVFSSERGQQLLKEWGIEGDYVGVGHCIVGHPAKVSSARKARKSDYIHYVR